MMNEFTPSLVDEWSAGAVALGLTGSLARGESTVYSDIDLVRFVEVAPTEEADRYTLCVRQGRLVSISTTTFEAKRASLVKPQEAIWAVEGLRQMHILADPDGWLADLLRKARAFTWDPLAQAADAYASGELMGNAEEAHKILGALSRQDESAAWYGTLGLILGLTRAMAVFKRVLFRSENRYLDQLQEAVGLDSAWVRYLRQACGLDLLDSIAPPALARGWAGLLLYHETARLLDPMVLPVHRAVIEQTLGLIEVLGPLAITLPRRRAGRP